MAPQDGLEPSLIPQSYFEKTCIEINTSCKLSPVEHFNDMPTKCSFN